jgi:hypothetical protein
MVEQCVQEPDKSMDPTARETADRGRDDGRYFRSESGCWPEGGPGARGFRLGDQTAGSCSDSSGGSRYWWPSRRLPERCLPTDSWWPGQIPAQEATRTGSGKCAVTSAPISE